MDLFYLTAITGRHTQPNHANIPHQTTIENLIIVCTSFIAASWAVILIKMSWCREETELV